MDVQESGTSLGSTPMGVQESGTSQGSTPMGAILVETAQENFTQASNIDITKNSSSKKRTTKQNKRKANVKKDHPNRISPIGMAQSPNRVAGMEKVHIESVEIHRETKK